MSVFTLAGCDQPSPTNGSPEPRATTHVPDQDASLVWIDADSPTEAGVAHALKPGQTAATFGAMLFCGSRRVHINDITLLAPEGLTIAASGARSFMSTDGGVGTDDAPPARLGFAPLPLDIDAPGCRPRTETGPTRQIEVAIQAKLVHASQAGSARGIDITYGSGEELHHTQVRLQIVLCPAADVKPCQ